MGAGHPERSADAAARLDEGERSRAAAAAARAGQPRSRQTHLGAGLPRAVGAPVRGPAAVRRPRMRVTMLVRCLAMMRGGGETRHLAWMRELDALGVEVDVIAGRPLMFGGMRHPVEGVKASVIRSPYMRDAVYRWQHTRGFGRITMNALHLDEEWFCRA